MEEKNIARFRENLEKKGFRTSHFKTAQEAADYLDAAVDGTTVGFGGSITLRELGLYPRLGAHNTVFWHWEDPSVTAKAATAAVYFSSVNAAAETGELINIDGGGNRLSSGLYGHETLYFVMGANKLAPDYAAALHRARNIAAPRNAQRLNRKTPCAVQGDRCYDCDSPERICAAMTVYWKKPLAIRNVEVVIVDEPLGY